jgi:hypothetical protein
MNGPEVIFNSQCFTARFTVLTKPKIPMLYESVDAYQKALIAMLQNGDYDQALCSFRRDLVEIRQCVPESASPEGPCGLNLEQPLAVEEQGIDTEHSGDVSTLILSVALGDSNLAETKAAKSSNILSFYNHAFVVGTLPTSYTRTSQQEIDHHVRLTTVLLFNMALTFHKKGLLDGPKSLESLEKAIQIYNLICMRMSLLSPLGGLEDLYVIQLASWKNMGHIYGHLAKKEDAIRCRAFLHQALFEDTTSSLGLMCGYPYASFYLFVVCSEVRRRGFKALSS